MVIKLTSDTLEEPQALQFVPRKKRKAVLIDAGKNVSQDNIQLRPQAPPPSTRGKQQVRSADSTPQVPSWRIQKEAKLESAPPENILEPSKQLGWWEKVPSEMTDRDWRIMRHDLELKCTFPIKPLINWNDLNTKDLSRSLLSKFPVPTPIQRAAIGIACWECKDLIAVAPTGSGKTIGFIVPIIELRIPKSLILAPTRELALQIAKVLTEYAPTTLNVVSLVGGHDFEQQAEELRFNLANFVIIATPGRLLDFLDQGLVDISNCDFLVFDEADRMIDMGFEPQISAIKARLNNQHSRRTMMFSATWPKSVQELSHSYLKSDYLKVEVGSIGLSLPKIDQKFELINADEKGKHKRFEKLVGLLRNARPPAICFVATKHAAESIAAQLNSKNIKSQCLHGGLNQSVRDHTLAALHSHKIKCLVATDIASRGVDVPGVSLVVNYDLPASAEIYVHRIGRTGRAGVKGYAVSFVSEADSALFPELRQVLKQNGTHIPDFMNLADKKKLK